MSDDSCGFSFAGTNLSLTWDDSSPAALTACAPDELLGASVVPLVEIFTATERHARTSQAFHRSAVGVRLRVRDVARVGDDTVVTQADDVSGLEVRTRIRAFRGAQAIQIGSEIRNVSDSPVVLTDVASASIGFCSQQDRLDDLTLHTAESEWLAENRWNARPLRAVLPTLSLDVHEQDGRGHFAFASHGAWSTGEHLPVGIITDGAGGRAFGWQIETSGGWFVDLSQTRTGGVLSLGGPSDVEHGFARRLDPGETFDAVTTTIAVSEDGLDGVVAELTSARRQLRNPESGTTSLPLVYNDFMNTLMGQPSTEALLPLIEAAGRSGAEYFCIDAGWFADPARGDWWSTVGEWREAPSRFTNGLKEVIEAIHAAGMRSGLWLEPEVVGIDSPVVSSLPPEAYFTRFGVPVVEDRRRHLDFRHPAVRAHLDATVDHLVAEYGVSFLKLDYNINPGTGTEIDATTAADGLLQHTRALRSWLEDVQRRHPDLLLENCSSGAMRADYWLLPATHLQSTSDQQDFALYPPIAASAPASILPEQCGNWAYPSAEMSLEETAFTMVTGLSGRLYLAGFLDRLSPEQLALVGEAVDVHKRWRGILPDCVPFWPLGLPAWDATVIALGLRTTDELLLFVWDRGEHAQEISLPVRAESVETVYPIGLTDWRATIEDANIVLRTTPGLGARVFSVNDGEPT